MVYSLDYNIFVCILSPPLISVLFLQGIKVEDSEALRRSVMGGSGAVAGGDLGERVAGSDIAISSVAEVKKLTVVDLYKVVPL